MANLYELTGIFQQLQDLDIDSDTFLDTLNSIDFLENAEWNVEHLVQLIRNEQANAEKFKAEKEAFKKKQEAAERKTDYYKEQIKNFLEGTGQKKFQTNFFTVSLRSSQSVTVTDETLIPEEFIKVKKEVKKADIKKYLSNHNEVPGAILTKKNSLMIR